MNNLTVVTITYNEEKNINQLLENVKGFASEVIVLDSYSVDRTVEIAYSYGARILYRVFDDFSKQRKYSLDQIEYNTDWVLVLDADEILTNDLKSEILREIKDSNYDAYLIKRRFYWKGQWLKRGYYPTWLLRLGRVGLLTCDDRGINEHLVCKSKKIGKLKHDFIDNNRKSISDWVNKHNYYSDMEATKLLQREPKEDYSNFLSDQKVRKKWIRTFLWNRLPLVFRPFLYFSYRYIFCLGFLDGSKAFHYHLLHAFFYRFLIDLKYLEIKGHELKKGNEPK